MSEWKKITWGDISILEYGKALKDYQSKSSGKVPVYGTNGRIGFTDSEPLCNFPSVIIGRKGAYRGVHFSSVPFFVIDTAFYLKPIYDDIIDLKFAYYKLINEDINRLDSGSAIPSTSRIDFYQLDLCLPPLEEQKQIADVLSSLDRKIDNLRRQNETLEKIAQTLFKHWFIDFEFPNAEGNPYKSSGGAMIPSELGDIPEGWRVGKLGDVAINNSETHNFLDKDKIIFINTGDVLDGNFLHNNYTSIYQLPGQAKKKIAKNDILYSEIRPKNKRFAYVNFNSNIEDYVVSTKFMVIRANNLILPRLLYLILKRQESIDEFNYIAESRSGTFPQITFESVSYFKFPLPPINLQKKIITILVNLLEKKEFNIYHIQTLTKTRDTLLPKLMSGQIRIKE